MTSSHDTFNIVCFFTHDCYLYTSLGSLIGGEMSMTKYICCYVVKKPLWYQINYKFIYFIIKQMKYKYGLQYVIVFVYFIKL